jgi:hypothetical protein
MFGSFDEQGELPNGHIFGLNDLSVGHLQKIRVENLPRIQRVCKTLRTLLQD